MLNGTGPIHAMLSPSIRLGAALALLAGALVADTGPAAAQGRAAPARIFVTIEGQAQGKFKAEGGPQFHDRIPVLRFSYEVVSPRDAASGLLTGRRQHKPVTIVKEWSAASTQIFQAVVNNETLKSVLIEFYRPNQSGQEEVVATVRLTDAAIARFTSLVSDPALGDAAAGRLVEHVEFTFKKIEISNPVAKMGAADSWESVR